MAAGLGIGWGINWGSIALSAKAVLDYLTFKLNFNTIATDFTFTRNSFATRVNENGLIETVTNLGSDLVDNGSFDELSSELITNGDFENGDTDWSFGGDWTLVNGTAEIQSSTQSYLRSDNDRVPLTVKTYKLQYEVITTNGSNLRLAGGSSAFGTITLDSATVGVKTAYITSNGTQAYLQINQNAFRGSIDNISLKQVDPNDDWIIEAVWTIQDGVASGNGAAGASQELKQDGTVTIGKTYEFSYEIKNYVSGSVGLYNDVVDSGGYNSGNGVYTGTFVASINQTRLRALIAFNGDVTNIVIQEVLTDDVPRIDYTGSTFDIPVLGDELVVNGDFATDSNWVKQNGWSIANGVATFDKNNYSGGSSNLYQTIMTVGKEYVLTFDIVDYVEGNFRVLGVSGVWSANGTYSVKFTASFAQLYLNVNPAISTILSIDNVSVKEVTAYTTTDKGAFLLEPISTNELIYSEDLSSWATFGSPIRTGGQDDLSGGTSAYAVEFPTANDFIRLLGVNTVGTFTASVYAKKSIGDTFYLNIAGNIGNYNFSTESFTPGTGSPTGDMIDFGNGWYRCIMTFSSTSTSSQVRIQSNSGSTVILWACQLEELPYASSYIPTSGTTVTRAQETCVDATPTINSEEGVLYAEISALVENDGIRLISLNDGTTGNIVQIYYSGSANKIICQTKVAGSTQSSLQYVASSQTDIHKVAFKYKENDFALWVDGVEINTDLVGSVWAEGTLTELDFDIGSGSLPFYGRTKDLRIYDKALTDSELTELTTI